MGTPAQLKRVKKTAIIDSPKTDNISTAKYFIIKNEITTIDKMVIIFGLNSYSS